LLASTKRNPGSEPASKLPSPGSEQWLPPRGKEGESPLYPSHVGAAQGRFPPDPQALSELHFRLKNQTEAPQPRCPVSAASPRTGRGLSRAGKGRRAKPTLPSAGQRPAGPGYPRVWPGSYPGSRGQGCLWGRGGAEGLDLPQGLRGVTSGARAAAAPSRSRPRRPLTRRSGRLPPPRSLCPCAVCGPFKARPRSPPRAVPRAPLSHGNASPPLRRRGGSRDKKHGARMRGARRPRPTGRGAPLRDGAYWRAGRRAWPHQTPPGGATCARSRSTPCWREDSTEFRAEAPPYLFTDSGSFQRYGLFNRSSLRNAEGQSRLQRKARRTVNNQAHPAKENCFCTCCQSHK